MSQYSVLYYTQYSVLEYLHLYSIYGPLRSTETSLKGAHTFTKKYIVQ